MARMIGVLCLVLFVVCVAWAVMVGYLSTDHSPGQIRFDGVFAAEGTTLVVKDGKLELVGSGAFSVDTPLRLAVDRVLGGLCLFMTLCAGIALLRVPRARSPQSG